MAHRLRISSERRTALVFAGTSLMLQILGYVKCIGGMPFFLLIGFGVALFVWPLFTKKFDTFQAALVIFLSILLLPLAYFLWIACVWHFNT